MLIFAQVVAANVHLVQETALFKLEEFMVVGQKISNDGEFL